MRLFLCAGISRAALAMLALRFAPDRLTQNGFELAGRRPSRVTEVDFVVLAMKGEPCSWHHMIVQVREDRPLIIIAADVKFCGMPPPSGSRDEAS